MKVYIIVRAFRESYNEPVTAGAYSDLAKAEVALEEWNAKNQDNCEEIRYLYEEELQ